MANHKNGIHTDLSWDITSYSIHLIGKTDVPDDNSNHYSIDNPGSIPGIDPFI